LSIVLLENIELLNAAIDIIADITLRVCRIMLLKIGVDI
jgi:hypothetical protein